MDDSSNSSGGDNSDVEINERTLESDGEDNNRDIPLPEHLTWSQKLGIEVGRLLRQGKKDMIGWVQEEMRQCLRSRRVTGKGKSTVTGDDNSNNNDSSDDDDDDIEAALNRPDLY